MKIHTKILYILACIFTLFLTNGDLHANGSQCGTGKIKGTITSRTTRQPIVGATIELRHCNRLIATTTTAHDGSYSFTCVGQGDYILKATAAGYQEDFMGAEIHHKKVVTVNFSLVQNVGTLKGKITDSVTTLPISGATVNIIRGSIIVNSTTTDSNGNYTFTNLEPSTYTVTAQATGYNNGKTSAKVQVGQTTTANLALKALPAPGTISGNVTDLITTVPIQNAEVDLFQGANLIAAVYTDSNGNYSIPNLEAGNYTVKCLAVGFQSQTQGATVTSGSTTTVNFALEPNPGTITGIVKDSNTGIPIQGATIDVIRGSLIISFAVTDPNGAYTISDLSPGSYRVYARAAGYQNGSTGANVNAGETTTANFSLVPLPGTIQGTVSDNLVNPIEGAEVKVFQGDLLISATLTDVNGDYEIDGLPPGAYNVEASATGFQSKTLGAQVTSNSTTIVDFVLAPLPGAIAGTVTDAITTDPIAGALVEVYLNQVLVAFAYTDASGMYIIDGLTSDSYVVIISADNYQPNVVGAIVVAPGTTIVNAALSRNPGAISGTVIARNTGKPISGAAVHLYVGDVVFDAVLTDNAGNYSLRDEPEGDYGIIVYATNYQAAGGSTHVYPGQTSVVNFKLDLSPGSVFGTVTDQNTGDPIAGATVSLYDGSIFIVSVLTDSFGNYTIDNLPPQMYNLVFTAPNYQDGHVGVLIISNNATQVNIALAENPSTIIGTVTDLNTSLPIPGATITVYLGDIVIDTVVTDDSGDYTVSGLALGFYTLTASATDYQTAFVGVNITIPGSLVPNVDFQLQFNPGSIAGTVMDSATGVPIAGAIVSVYDGMVLIDSVFTDSSGNYIISGLAPNGYTIIVEAGGYQTAITGALVIAGKTTTVNFALMANPGTLTGNVSSSSGGGIYGATVAVFLDHVFITSVLTDPNGNYIVPNLAPGDYVVVASSLGSESAVGTATIISDTTTTLNFILMSSPGSIQGHVTDAPIPGAIVSLYQGDVFIANGVTNFSGYYFITGLAPGTYTAVAEATGFSTEFAPVSITSSGLTTQDFLMTTTDLGSISGTVTDVGTGEPIAGATIAVFSGSMLITIGVTDSNGKYFISDLTPGDYTVQALANIYVSASASATVVADENTEVNFALVPIPLNPTSVKGKAVDNKFLTQTDRVHIICWEPSPSPFIVKYLVYQDGQLVASVNASSTCSLCYESHNNSKNRSVTYTIVAVNSFGQGSTGITVTVK